MLLLQLARPAAIQPQYKRNVIFCRPDWRAAAVPAGQQEISTIQQTRRQAKYILIQQNQFPHFTSIFLLALDWRRSIYLGGPLSTGKQCLSFNNTSLSSY